MKIHQTLIELVAKADLGRPSTRTPVTPDILREQNSPNGCIERRWVWSYDDLVATKGGMYGSAVAHDLTVYIGDESNYYADDSGDTPDHNIVIALDAETGEERWRFDGVGPSEGTPVFHDDMLYIPGDGWMQTIDVRSRELLWERDYVSDVYDADHESSSHPSSRTTGTCMQAATRENVFGIRAGTGDVEWVFTTEGLTLEEILDDVGSLEETTKNGDMHAPLALADDTVYVPTWGNRVYAPARRTGEKGWSFSTNTMTHGDRPLP